MRKVGIVAEYDPFHNGHAWQLSEARRLSGADAVIVVMSGFFTQRGDPACLSPFDRASCALENGADLVALLPAAWSTRSAEDFALASLRILQGLGADAVSFGAETSDLSLLTRVACAMDSASVLHLLHAGLNQGLSWFAAMTAALSETDPSLGALLYEPNNALAIAYLRAASRLNWQPTFHPVLRSHPHRSSDFTENLASGSAIRKALQHKCWSSIRNAVPEKTFRCLSQAAEQENLVSPSDFDRIIMARLRTMSPSDFAALPGSGEGLDQALQSAAQQCITLDELLNRLTGKRYSRVRIRRLCISALLGIRKTDLFPLPDSAVIIGVRSGMEALLHPQLPDFQLLIRTRDYPSDAPWFQTECRAADLWALIAGLPGNLWQRMPLVRI